jgi:hypothetical protein
LIIAEIDPTQSAEARQRIPSLKNERPFMLPEAERPAPMRSVS